MTAEGIIHMDQLRNLSETDRRKVYFSVFSNAIEQLTEDSSSGIKRFYLPDKDSQLAKNGANFVIVGDDDTEVPFRVVGRAAHESVYRRELSNKGVKLYTLRSKFKPQQLRSIDTIKKNISETVKKNKTDW